MFAGATSCYRKVELLHVVVACSILWCGWVNMTMKYQHDNEISLLICIDVIYMLAMVTYCITVVLCED